MTVPTWVELEGAPSLQNADLKTYVLRQASSATDAAPGSYRLPVLDVSPTDATEPPAPSAKPVLAFYDTQSWCPFAARVQLYLKIRGDLEHDVALIDLRNKPPYYPKVIKWEREEGEEIERASERSSSERAAVRERAASERAVAREQRANGSERASEAKAKAKARKQKTRFFLIFKEREKSSSPKNSNKST